jgi:hypothetical protein
LKTISAAFISWSTSSLALDIFALSLALLSEAITTAESTPISATTIKSSIKVKPSFFLNRMLLDCIIYICELSTFYPHADTGQAKPYPNDSMKFCTGEGN